VLGHKPAATMGRRDGTVAVKFSCALSGKGVFKTFGEVRCVDIRCLIHPVSISKPNNDDVLLVTGRLLWQTRPEHVKYFTE